MFVLKETLTYDVLPQVYLKYVVLHYLNYGWDTMIVIMYSWSMIYPYYLRSAWSVVYYLKYDWDMMTIVMYYLKFGWSMMYLYYLRSAWSVVYYWSMIEIWWQLLCITWSLVQVWCTCTTWGLLGVWCTTEVWLRYDDNCHVLPEVWVYCTGSTRAWCSPGVWCTHALCTYGWDMTRVYNHVLGEVWLKSHYYFRYGWSMYWVKCD